MFRTGHSRAEPDIWRAGELHQSGSAVSPVLRNVGVRTEVVWELKENDLPGNPLRFVGGFEHLPNGNLLLCNWPCHGFEAKQPLMVEVTRGKKAVWQWTSPKLRGIAHIALLESSCGGRHE